jgi:nucleoid DNA-binding protein
MTRDELIDLVSARTHGTREAPLTRDDVAKVVDATLKLLSQEQVQIEREDAEK